MMKVAFERMAPLEEREIASFVESKGGNEAVLNDDRLLKQIMEKQQKGKTELPGVDRGGEANVSPLAGPCGI